MPLRLSRAPAFESRVRSLSSRLKQLPLTLAGASFCCWTLCLLCGTCRPGPAAPAVPALLHAGGAQPRARDRTLVIYVYSGNDPEYKENFRFFINEAVQGDDNCHYFLVLQQDEKLVQPYPLPVLPPNARYVHHKNECFDIGTVGWVLQNTALLGPHGIAEYRYFVWLNASVRGPFMPAYLRGRMHWTEPLLSKLTDTVKLVGPSINCGGAGDALFALHVQSYVLATDATGLQVLLDDEKVFQCYEDMHQTIRHSELGTSEAIMRAGYSIDSLMLRYQGVDWRDPAFTRSPCNAGRNPLVPGGNDGINVDPLEVLFLKVKDPMVREERWPHTTAAVKFAEWADQAREDEARRRRGDRAAATARIASVAASDMTELVGDLQRRGIRCFDYEFYINSSHDLSLMWDQPNPHTSAWAHFLSFGLYEGRMYRFTC